MDNEEKKNLEGQVAPEDEKDDKDVTAEGTATDESKISHEGFQSEDAMFGHEAAVSGIIPGLLDRDVANEVRTAFLDYSMSVIVARAIPDVRDGFKPVQRRIIFGMCHYVGASFADVNPPAFDNLDGWIALLENPTFFNTTVVDYLAYYSSYAVISSILIFPASLTNKDRLKSYLDSYNVDKNGNQKPDADRIVYSDIMDTYTSSLGILINVISAVLVVFASISLAVSSVMTAIITYVSVLERTKEIGILRACGARKVDIRRLFEAECMITGFVAGVIGIGVSLLICIPINLTLDHLYSNYQLSSIAQLNPVHAVILLVLAVFLAFISGFIPARIAAGKDPVECLRSE